ncbi:putative ribonuclease T(2) [Rosa chinensis]|uniref:Putative ribonuclease T(2) n=1 Tax=Rosa chinensis TaxID=74649 RepID=A0A2P6RKX0_ROSCH|nr:putative ribonuclease T(2) [Rosa chinensis]
MMSSFLTIFLCFQLLLAVPNPLRAKISAPDSFLLVIVWPNTFCLFQSNPCQQLPQSFTLHGLWPQAEGSSLKCTSVPMIDSILKGNKDDLERYWPNLKHTKFDESKKFWISEWIKHGSCSAKTPANYLSLVFDLMKKIKKFDVKKIFEKHGKI